MPKKSRGAAARYAAKSKEGKRRKHAFVPPPPGPTAPPAPRKEAPEIRPTVRARPRAAPPTYEYRYVLGELKRIGILAGGVFFILILLAFLLD